MGILLVLSVTDKSSFNSVELWMRQIRQYSAEEVPILILCNKIDIQAREVSDIQCKALEKRHQVRTINTSALNNHNVFEAIHAIYDKITEDRKIRHEPKETHLVLPKQPSPSSGCKC